MYLYFIFFHDSEELHKMNYGNYNSCCVVTMYQIHALHKLAYFFECEKHGIYCMVEEAMDQIN